MLTTAQVRHLQELHDTLANRPDIGPVEPPLVRSVHLCGQGAPRWLYDTTTTELAIQIAKRADHHYACRFRVLGLRFGPPRLDPLRHHYGLTHEQITRMTEIDFQPIPDAKHSGRQVWLKRQQDLIMRAIQAGRPARPASATTKDDLTVLTSIEQTRHPEPANTPAPVPADVN